MECRNATGMARRLSVACGAVLLAIVMTLANMGSHVAFASGNPPANVTVVNGINSLHGGNHSLKKHGVTRVKPSGATTPGGAIPNVTASTASNPVYGTDPIVFIHGINAGLGSPHITCTGAAELWSNPISYLKNSWHPGLGSDSIDYTGQMYVVGYYNDDVRCSVNDAVNATGFQLSTQYSDWAPACDHIDGTDYTDSTNQPTIGTVGEPIEHIACEFAWYLWDTFSRHGDNVKIVAHSMGGTIARYMLAKVQEGDSAFPPYLEVSDIVTISSPHAGLSQAQETGEEALCSCYEAIELQKGSDVMNYIYNHDDPQALDGTDWTNMGSLASGDYIDWFWQATYLSRGHRLGYSYPIKCNGQTDQPNGYDHGSYVNDMCDAYDAPQYYQDFGGRDSQTYYYTTSAPHSLHNMLMAFIYYSW